MIFLTDINKTIKALERRQFKVKCVQNADEACRLILDMIPPDKSVGVGGSKTLIDIGLLDALHNRGCDILSTYIAKKTGGNVRQVRNDSINADIYLTSSNAITESGELYNTDMIGNRVAAMFYGPETVIVVAGRNKIVKGRKQAQARVKSTASPLNTKKLHKKTPCALTGRCTDCDAADRICRITVILEWVPPGKDIYVVLADEDLGF